MTQNERELLFLRNAVIIADAYRADLIKAAAADGVVVHLGVLRELDANIKQCKEEIGRSIC